jgi:hypothetical protein
VLNSGAVLLRQHAQSQQCSVQERFPVPHLYL